MLKQYWQYKHNDRVQLERVLNNNNTNNNGRISLIIVLRYKYYITNSTMNDNDDVKLIL